jgi:alkylation response protein AidB-like acyl-CoA dehydrogenase
MRQAGRRQGEAAADQRERNGTAPRSTITQIYEGTNQIQRMVMAWQLLK